MSGINRIILFPHVPCRWMVITLDEAGKIAHGSFHYYYSNGNVQSTGNYVNNKKEGTWLGFYFDGSPHDSIVYVNGAVTGIKLSWHANGYLKDSVHTRPDGSAVAISWYNNGNPSAVSIFRDGKKNGRFRYFHKSGQLASEEVYNMDALVSKQYFDEGGTPMDTTNRDRMHSFPGGKNAWLKHASKKTYFPDQWQLVNTTQVTILVTGMIDEEGKVQNLYVSIPFHPVFDKIALRMVQESPKWLPAISHNRTVSTWFTQPVSFVQEH